MVRVPGGPFLMGSPRQDGLRDAAEPEQHTLALDYDYAIGKHAVTVGLFRAFIDAGGYQEPGFWTRTGWRISVSRTQPDHWTNQDWAGNDRLPVVGVSWYEAYAYARWLAESTGRAFRLPTESEWEKAARGGLRLPDGPNGWQANPHPARAWPWGDEPPDASRINFANHVKHTTPVGEYPGGASPYGALDMAGNVWEWCLSCWADPYLYPEDVEPEGDCLRVVRGGSWFNAAHQARCSYRLSLIANLRFDHDVGFRVVLADLP